MKISEKKYRALFGLPRWRTKWSVNGQIKKSFQAALLLVVGSGALMAQDSTAKPTDASAAPQATSAKPINPGQPAVTTNGSSSSGQLDTVVVKDTALTPQDQAAYDRSKTTGDDKLVDLNTVYQSGKVSTLADLFQNQAGVFAQSVAGNDSLRISIRGSGLNRGANGGFREGIQFLYDGLPLTGPGGTPYELFEPLGLQGVEIAEGPAGIKYGALDYGGSINLVTNTGYTASPFESRFEAGSFGYTKEEVSSGAVVGKNDYYVALIDRQGSGFQDHSEENAFHFIGNWGYKFNEDLDNRFYFRFGYEDNQLPGSLTLNQVQTTPYISQTNNIGGSPLTGQYTPRAQQSGVPNTDPNSIDTGRRQPGSKWVADRLTYKIDDDSKIEVSVVYHDYPIVAYSAGQAAQAVNLGNSQPVAVPASITRQDWEFVDVSGVVNYNRTEEILGRKSVTNLGLVSTTEVYGTVWNIDTNNNAVLKEDTYGGSANHEVHLTNDLQLFPDSPLKDLYLTTGAQGAWIRRESEVQYPIDTRYKRDSYYFDGQAGLRYEVNPDVQVYTLFSQTTEPTDDWKYSGGTLSGGLLGGNRTNLDDQQARNIEVGTRVKEGIFEGSLILYRSWIKHELLTVNVAPGTNVNFNGDHTFHQGIEAGLKTTLWQEEQAEKTIVPGGQAVPVHRVTFNQTYTLGDFEYQDEPQQINTTNGLTAAVGNNNKLPGFPTHLYQGELKYEHPTGFYAAVNTQVASSYFADYANTLAVPAYEIFGSSVGYAPPHQNWSVNVDFDNITDQKYVTAISPTFNAGGNGAYLQSVFQPGDGFGAYGSIVYKF